MSKRSVLSTCARATAIAIALLTLVNDARAATVTVPAGGDLQAALDAARPGDTILLVPGVTYVGNFVLPVHGGTSYVTIRTAGNDSNLPAAGVRITPAHAAYLAALRSPSPTATPWLPALRTAPGAAYWRVMLLEFLANMDGDGDIVGIGDGSSAQSLLSQVPHHITLDRLYIHGDPLIGQKRGIALNGSSITITNCHISDMKAIPVDTQAIAGWNGPGPFHIENNRLEASGEAFIMGGDDPKIAGLVPADLVMRRNVLTRPLSWRNPIMATPGGVSAAAGTGGTLAAGTYGYRVTARRAVAATFATSLASAEVTATVGAGGRVTIRWAAVATATEYNVYGRTPGGQNAYWTVTATSFTDTGADGTSGSPPATASVWKVKNLLELKNTKRARLEFNLLEYNWSAAQNGIAVLFTPRNQYGGCTQCTVEDVTFEYNTLRNVAGGINILGYDDHRPTQQAKNITIRHNLISGLDRTAWGGSGYFIQILGGPRDITVDHNTIISPNGLAVVAVGGPATYGFVFTNNLARHNSYGIFGTGKGYGNAAITYYFPDAVIRRNVLAGGSASKYPGDNFFPSTTEFAAHFVDYAGDDYALVPGTDWAGAGLDGQDLGADIATLRSAPPSDDPLYVVTASLPDAEKLEPYSAILQAEGGSPPYLWGITAGALPAGITLDASTGTLFGTPSASGTFTFTARVTDSKSATASRAFNLRVVAAVNAAPDVSLRADRSGVIPVGATVQLTADALDPDGTVTRVDFLLDGAVLGSDTTSPFTRTWVATEGGPYSFAARATDNAGATGTSAALIVSTTAEVVLYAEDVARMVGDYQLAADATAAGGSRLWNPNRGAAKLASAAALPASYAEFTFYAVDGRPYHLWIRGKGEENKWANDSAFIQFSETVDANGAAVARIGTTGWMWYSVEEYGNAGLSNWGWQDNGYGLGVVGAPLYFARTGLQTIRIQPREDGLSIDQIVISPAEYLTLRPGLAKADSTIVPRP